MPSVDQIATLLPESPKWDLATPVAESMRRAGLEAISVQMSEQLKALAEHSLRWAEEATVSLNDVSFARLIDPTRVDPGWAMLSSGIRSTVSEIEERQAALATCAVGPAGEAATRAVEDLKQYLHNDTLESLGYPTAAIRAEFQRLDFGFLEVAASAAATIGDNWQTLLQSQSGRLAVDAVRDLAMQYSYAMPHYEPMQFEIPNRYDPAPYFGYLEPPRTCRRCRFCEACDAPPRYEAPRKRRARPSSATVRARERKQGVAKLAADGMTRKEIAKKLRCSERTVYNDLNDLEHMN